MLAAFGQHRPGEYEVKAAYLLNFIKYLEWPSVAFASSVAPLTLCVAGRDPFDGALAAYEHRIVQTRELRVRHGVGLDELPGCHMLFLAESEEPHVQQFLRATSKALSRQVARSVLSMQVNGFSSRSTSPVPSVPGSR